MSSCDPAYDILISNKAQYDKEIQVRVLNKSISFYEGKDNIFKLGKFIRKDSLLTSSDFFPVIIPSGQTLMFTGVFIKAYSEDAVIINNDTMDIRTSQYKKSGLPIKYAYSITE